MSEYKVEISSDNTITVGLPSTGNGVAGPRGEQGLSAYDIAKKNGFTGTDAEWLATLKGEKGEKGEPGVNGTDGKPGKDGVDGTNGADGKPGANGLSAYELAAKNGFTGNESAWLASLKGDKGEQGPKGDDGQNGVNGVDGKDGLSAYTIAVKNGYTGSESEWANKWLRGTIVSASTDSDGNMLLTDINGNTITTPLKPLAEAATSAKEAATSAGNAKTSEQNASASAAASAVSATDSANSAKEAATSAANAAESANIATSGQVNADWNVTDSTSKAFIKNKPQVIDEQGVTTIAQRITDAGLDDVRLYMANGITTKALTVYEESSVPTANAGNSSKAIANTEFVAKSIAALVNGAPDQLNTLNELAKALGNDSNFASTVTAELAKKLNSIEAESTYATKTEAGVPYQIKRNTAYKVGDVLTSPSLPPGCVIVVTQAGTTGSTEPDWTTIKSNIGGVIADNTVTFYINDTLSKHSLGDIVYKPLTKVTEHEYLLPLDGQTIDGTTYKRLADYLGTTTLPNLNGRYLRADSTPGTMVEAGLPEIEGNFSTGVWLENSSNEQKIYNGCFEFTRVNDSIFTPTSNTGNSAGFRNASVNIRASRSSAIYGKSTTVTPLTYTVRAYIAYA